MKIIEIIQPNIDRDLLLLETLKHSVTSAISDFYQNNKNITGNYSREAADVFSFDELNRQKLKSIVITELGVESETYRIIDFLESYFRY